MAARTQRRFYWTRFTDGSGRWSDRGSRPPGEDLAALRQGAGRDPGAVPSLWPHHRVTIDDDWLARHRHDWSAPADFQAEHHALTLYGFHQQSVTEPMHVADVGFGRAMLRLRLQRDQGGEAIDRRFAAAATSATVDQLVSHLRRLVALLRGIRQPLDYSVLFRDLCRWQFPATQGRVRRAWGLQYYAGPKQNHDDERDLEQSNQGNGAA